MEITTITQKEDVNYTHFPKSGNAYDFAQELNRQGCEHIVSVPNGNHSTRITVTNKYSKETHEVFFGQTLVWGKCFTSVIEVEA